MNKIGERFRAVVLAGAVASVLVLASGAKAQNTWPYATNAGKAPVLAVVGDIACQPGEATPQGEANHELCINPKLPYTSSSLWLSQEATANQIEAMKPDAVAITGDLQYQVGQYSDFQQSFDLTYGAFKFLHRPSPGNHEFYDEHGARGVAGYGYFSYYNGFQIDANGNPITTTIPDPCPQALRGACNYPGNTAPNPQPIPRADGQAGHFELGPNGGVNGSGVADGWYSYNLGSWHLISLNIECSTQPDGCDPNGTWFGAELQWLQNDLASNHSACTAAYWHQPTFSAANSITPEGIAAQNFWQLLYQYGADLVLNGHDHLYAHYRPLNPSGNYDPVRGIREIIVGTGGETLDPVVTANTTTADPSGNPNFNALNLEANSTGNFWGVMALTLNPNGYKWYFQSALQAPVAPAGTPSPFIDQGVGTCHNGANSQGNQQ